MEQMFHTETSTENDVFKLDEKRRTVSFPQGDINVTW